MYPVDVSFVTLLCLIQVVICILLHEPAQKRYEHVIFSFIVFWGFLVIFHYWLNFNEFVVL
jgi:hypothetical protein